VHAVLKAGAPVNANYLRETLGLNGLRMNRVLASLVNAGVLERSPHPLANRMEMRYSPRAKLLEWTRSNAISESPGMNMTGT
jgi:DNA-binding IclR family transcriptional regulator